MLAGEVLSHSPLVQTPRSSNWVAPADFRLNKPPVHLQCEPLLETGLEQRGHIAKMNTGPPLLICPHHLSQAFEKLTRGKLQAYMNTGGGLQRLSRADAHAANADIRGFRTNAAAIYIQGHGSIQGQAVVLAQLSQEEAARSTERGFNLRGGERLLNQELRHGSQIASL